MQKYAHVCRHLLRAHFEFHMRARTTMQNQTCRSTLEVVVIVVCVFACACYFSCSYMSHTYLYNGLKVALNNEIPVSTSLSFRIPFCRLRVPCTTHTVTSAYFSIASTISSFSPALYIRFSCK